MKKKILIFVQSGVGGAERVSVTIGKKLDKSKFSVSFFAIGPWENKIKEFIPQELYRDHIKEKNPIKLLLALYRAIKNEKPDVVFSSVMNINTKLMILSFLFKKTRFIIRSDNNYEVFSKKQKILIRLLYKRAAVVIAQTEEMKYGLVVKAGLSENKVVVLHNPIDEDRIKESLKNCANPFPNNGNKHFVASGRFAEAKGFDVLVAAFANLKNKVPNIDLTIIGNMGSNDNPVFLGVRKLIESNNLKESVFCLGFKNNPYPYVKYADCFVLSSRYEGLPNVLIEALFLGTPVAATKCIPIMSRIVNEGKNGFISEVESADSLMSAMEKALSLGRIISSYQPAKITEFENLFS